MWIKSQGVVISTIKYGNTSAICKVFTLHSGLVSFVIKGVYTPKKQGIKPAIISPLNWVEIEYVLKAHQNFAQLKELHCIQPAHQAFLCSKKRAASALILEVMMRCLTDYQPASDVFGLLQKTLQELEQPEPINAWFVHLFLVELSHILGHTIQTHSYQEQSLFDIPEGSFLAHNTQALSQHCADPRVSAQLVALVSDPKSADMQYRKPLLNVLLQFAHVHFLGSAPLKCIPVFNQTL